MAKQTVKTAVDDAVNSLLDLIPNDEIKEELSNTQDILSSINELINTNVSELKTLRNLSAKVKDLLDKYIVVEELYKNVSGTKSQTVKLTFEAYVQQYYFQQVIAAANKRLNVLTNGMFVLRCKEEARNMRSQAGLDLDVLDRQTGNWRDVSTLSGGESFMASLALALGLSDVVQAQSGGIRMDSMFSSCLNLTSLDLTYLDTRNWISLLNRGIKNG